LEIIDAEGTHPRGGLARIRTTWIFTPPFEMPGAALWVDDATPKSWYPTPLPAEANVLSFKGTANIYGKATDVNGNDCSAPYLLHHTTSTTPEVPAEFNGLPPAFSGGTYPFSLVKDTLLKQADWKGPAPTSVADKVKQLVQDKMSEGEYTVLVIEGDFNMNNSSIPDNGTGIIFVDGNLTITGGADWNGLVIATGDLTVGGGNSTITGSVITGESGDVMITGELTVQYDCQLMFDLYDNYSSYRMTSWRQM